MVAQANRVAEKEGLVVLHSLAGFADWKWDESCRLGPLEIDLICGLAKHLLSITTVVWKAVCYASIAAASNTTERRQLGYKYSN